MLVTFALQNWTSLMSHVSAQDPSALDNIASFSARNAHFPTNEPEPNDGRLRVERFHRRSELLFPVGDSVKSFVNTRAAAAIFNHYALETLSPFQTANVHISEELVQKNHYRGGGYDWERLGGLVEDKSMQRYVPRLAERVKMVAKEMGL